MSNWNGAIPIQKTVAIATKNAVEIAQPIITAGDMIILHHFAEEINPKKIID